MSNINEDLFKGSLLDGENFKADGKVFLVRCPECKRENWAMAVADGVCAWCGYDGNLGYNPYKPIEDNEPEKE